MAKGFYVPVSGLSAKAKKWYVPVNGYSKIAAKAYCSKEGFSKQFWPPWPSTVIFANGEFDNVPVGFDFDNNIEGCTTKIADLQQYFQSNSLLWVYDSDLISNPWIVNQDGLIDSDYDDYEVQILKNEIYIPINRIASPTRLKIIAKGNLSFNACQISNNKMTCGNEYGSICSENLEVKEIDISNNEYVDYIEILAPDTYASDDESVDNPYIYRPIPFKIQNHLYTNNNGFGLPGYEINQLSGGQMYCFLKYREPDGNEQCLYIMSKEAFSVELIGRWGNPSTREVVNSTQLQANPPIHAVIRESYWWGYKWQDIPSWHTGYYGGWNTNWDKQVGQIVLYGDYNVLPIPTGVQNPLQLIKRIEVIKEEIE